MSPSPLRCGLGPWRYSLSRPQRVHLCYGPVTRSLPWGDLVDRLQSFSFHHLCYPNYGALTPTPAGLSPEKRRLIENTGLIKTAVEEILRFESSNQLGNRMTTAQVELGGITLAAGTPVTLCIGAANRDPAQFSKPDNLDIGSSPNRHLAFGTGAHQCAGMALARLEGAIAISRFLARFPGYALNGPPVRGGRVRFRGFLSVPCLVG